MACGAAGGIAATFNAPIAGVFFALEVILRDFQAESFGVVVLSSVTASAIGRVAFGSATFLHLPQFQLAPWRRVPPVRRSGRAGRAWSASRSSASSTAARTSPTGCGAARSGLRPAVGGILLGLLLLLVPQMYGVGYPVLDSAVAGHYVVGLPARC